MQAVVPPQGFYRCVSNSVFVKEREGGREREREKEREREREREKVSLCTTFITLLLLVQSTLD